MSPSRLNLGRRRPSPYQNGRTKHDIRPWLEELERRRLLSYTVNDSGDAPLDPSKGPAMTKDGTITLRSAIQQIDIDGGGEIDFSVSMVDCSDLPAIGVPATINGGAIGSVVISGSGLTFTAGGSVAEYLVINGSSGDGIDMSGANNQVLYDYIGTDQTGMGAVGNAGSGVHLFGAGNTVTGCVLSANGGDGVLVDGSGATGNLITGDRIGTNAAGTAALGNADWGVILDQGASNTVGGTSASDRNVISGNKEGGIAAYGGSATGDLIEGNYIGTDVTGMIALGNAYGGVYVGSGSLFSDNPPGSASGATVGGTAMGAGNLIAGNDTALTGNGGIVIYGTGASNNLLEGNLVGVNATGNAALVNQGVGIDIFGGATGNTVGGSIAAAANVVSGNSGDGANGINIAGPGTAANLVEGNLVGVDITGKTAIANGASGIVITSSTNNTIGGSASGQANVASGNTSYGIAILGSGASGNLIEGNYVGTDPTGTAALPNASGGVIVFQQATNNTIGGTSMGTRNLVSGNKGDGIDIDNSGTSQNVVEGNLVGTDINDSVALANTGDGIDIGDSASSNTVGGTTSGAANVLSGNGGDGIVIEGSASSNLIVGDDVGVNAAGTTAIANTGDGIDIAGAGNNTVGGTAMGAGNVVSGNKALGLFIYGSGTSGNVVAGNRIGTDISGTIAVGNGSLGIGIAAGAVNNTLGGTTSGAGNLISGNQSSGVVISDAGTTGNLVVGNLVGTNATGATAIGNTGQGILVGNGATGNTIGGTTAGARNIVSGNNGDGIDINNAGTSQNLVEGNYIGTDITGSMALGDLGIGLSIGDGATANTVGGTSSAAGNVVSGNKGSGSNGINITGPGTSGNLVEANLVGIDATGTVAMANGGSGIVLTSANDNTVGGTTAGAGNIVSGNSDSGIALFASGTTGDVIEGNYVGTNAAGTAAIGNASVGVIVFDGAVGNTIGGTTEGARNIISGNLSQGILIFDDGTPTTGNLIEGNLIGTDFNGMKAIGNTGQGINIGDGASNNTIGGTVAGTANVISGNNGDGIDIDNSGTSQNVVVGNYIGTDINDSMAVGNSGVGVNISDSASNNTVGGTTSAAANVIAASGGDGLDISGSGTTDNVVAGNVFGTSADGSIDMGNQGNGIAIMDASSDTIGGDSSGAGNVIGDSGVQIGVAIAAASTGSSGNGIFIMGQAANNPIQGNYIGITRSGRPVGNSTNGILIQGASNNTIGGTNTGYRNYISANGGAGILIVGGSNGTPADGNMVQGNYIGTDTSGRPSASPPLGNVDGVFIEAGASNNTIGAIASGPVIGSGVTSDPASNIIAGNKHDGVVITATGVNATGNRISQNALYDNANMGIDLGNDSITAPNDHVGAAGPTPDNWQSYPVISSIVNTAAGATVSFFVPVPGVTTAPTAAGIAGPTYTVEFYANAGTTAGLSQGQQYLGSATVLGNQMMTLPFTPTAVGTQYITAIAIDPDGNTSEFSPCRDLLRDSLMQGTDPTYGPRPGTTYPGSIVVFFWPHLGATQYTLARAAQICDVDHFNWTQTITALPPGMHYAVQTVPASGPPTPIYPGSPPAGIPDPVVSLTSYYEVTSDAVPGVTATVANLGFDEYRFYVNEYATPRGGAALALPNYYVTFDPSTRVGTYNGSFTASNALEFADAPNMPEAFDPSGAYKSFRTQLTGVFGDWC